MTILSPFALRLLTSAACMVALGACGSNAARQEASLTTPAAPTAQGMDVRLSGFEKDVNTAFDVNDADQPVTAEVTARVTEAYNKRSATQSCGELDLSPSSYTETDGGWRETWRADMCEISFVAPITGEKRFLRGDKYSVEKPRIYEMRTAVSDDRANRTVASAQPAAFALASDNAIDNDVTISPPVKNAATGTDPRLQLLPLELRREVAKMPKGLQELYFEQYTK